jgi:hypothetical protein
MQMRKYAPHGLAPGKPLPQIDRISRARDFPTVGSKFTKRYRQDVVSEIRVLQHAVERGVSEMKTVADEGVLDSRSSDLLRRWVGTLQLLTHGLYELGALIAQRRAHSKMSNRNL